MPCGTVSRCSRSSTQWAGPRPEAHRSGLERIGQAGAQPISWVSLACELQQDWARVDTVADVVDIVLTTRLLASV
ncbi:MAG: hydrolase [Actinobacteria bacterium]|nr:hydrolase [Actinomycetota bacterium]